MLKDKIEIRTSHASSIVAKLEGGHVSLVGSGPLNVAQTKALAAWLGAAAAELELAAYEANQRRGEG